LRCSNNAKTVPLSGNPGKNLHIDPINDFFKEHNSLIIKYLYEIFKIPMTVKNNLIFWTNRCQKFYNGPNRGADGGLAGPVRLTCSQRDSLLLSIVALIKYRRYVRRIRSVLEYGW